MRWLFSSSSVWMLALVPTAFAQHAHSDVEFEYTNGMIDIKFGPEGQVFEADLETSGTFEQNTDDPGFASETGDGLGVEPDNLIDYNILGPLRYHDGNAFAPVPGNAGIVIDDNPNGGMTVTASTVGPVSGTGVITQADEFGDVHAHVDFTLEPQSLDTAEFGAYGILMELTTDEPGIANSDPFYIVFNFGLEEDENLPGPHFHDAVEDFAASVPEPSSLFLAALGGVLLLVRRRRR